jgi:hypothetical protein
MSVQVFHCSEAQEWKGKKKKKRREQRVGIFVRKISQPSKNQYKNQEKTSEITTHAHMRRASGYMSGWPALYESVSTQGGSFDRKSLIFLISVLI